MSKASKTGTARAAVRRALGGVLASVLLACALAAAGALVPSAVSAAINVTSFDASIDDSAGNPERQAGAHPNVGVSFRLETTNPSNPMSTDVIEQMHRSFVELPPGLVGDATQIPTCPDDQMKAGSNNNSAVCPTNSQVGYALISQGSLYFGVPIYNLGGGGQHAAVFGFTFLGAVVRLVPTVRAGDYGITMDSGTISQGAKIAGADVVLWGVPQDPTNDPERVAPGGQLTCLNPAFCFGGQASNTDPPTPLLSLPTSCTDDPLRFDLAVDGWRSQGAFTERSVTADANDVPFTITGCDRLPFDVDTEVRATSRTTDAPSGVDVNLSVAQNRNPTGVAAAHVKDVTMELPKGFAVSPSSAVGLDACSPGQIDLSSNGPHSCPVSSKLGTVTVETPLLDERLSGGVYLATPDANPFGSLVALYIVAEGSGVRLKIPGRVDLNPTTGQPVATFENNPQLPFSNLHVRLDGGENASLATPTACGRYDVDADVASWSGEAANLISPLVVDQGCGPRGFSPSFAAGSANPVGGSESAFSIEIGRPDRTQELSTLQDVRLPEGLLGKVAGVPLCPDAAADAGTCAAESRVGHVQVAAGPGGSPVWLPERGKAPTSVFLAGAYKGAAYSLSVVVPAQAGPFDLGRVVVRSPLHVDRVTAQLSTGIDVARVYDRRGNLSQTIPGGMPRIVEGIPLRLRELRVIVDRPDFVVNPTDCSVKSIDATLGAVTGQTKTVSSRFQVGDCAALGFDPEIGLRLKGRRQAKTGGHPAVRAVVRQGDDEAGIRRAVVGLPKSLALDPDNAQALCEFEDGTKPDLENHCPEGSIVGRARAKTPLLDHDLVGDVYFVKNIRIDPDTGNEIRTLPMLVVALRGRIAINLTGESSTTKNGRLVNTFAQVPDAPISRFNLNLKGGKNGILTVTRTRRSEINLCTAGRQVAIAKVAGHNGKRADQRILVRKPCGNRRKAAAAVCRTRVDGKAATRRCVTKVKRNRAQARRANKRNAAQRGARS